MHAYHPLTDEPLDNPPPLIQRRLILSANALFFLLSLGLFLTGVQQHLDVDRRCFRLHNFYTPALPHINPQYRLVQFNVSFGRESPYSPVSLDEGPDAEIDRNWDALIAGPMNVPLSAVEQSGETSEVVRLPPSLGGGYLAWAEVSHQLHCVNMLRKAIYAEYYRNRTRDLQQDRHLVYKHLDHCVDLLRQVLLCNADTGIQLHHWVKRNPTPVPNGNTWHKCKDTESILAWTRDRQVIFPPGERSIPILPGSSVYEGNP